MYLKIAKIYLNKMQKWLKNSKNALKKLHYMYINVLIYFVSSYINK